MLDIFIGLRHKSPDFTEMFSLQTCIKHPVKIQKYMSYSHAPLSICQDKHQHIHEDTSILYIILLRLFCIMCQLLLQVTLPPPFH